VYHRMRPGALALAAGCLIVLAAGCGQDGASTAGTGRSQAGPAASGSPPADGSPAGSAAGPAPSASAGGEPPAPTGSAARPGRTTAPGGTRVPPALPAGQPLVSVVRAGGIAGVHERLTVYPDGRVERASRTARCDGRLTAAQTAALRTELDRARVTRLPPPSGRPPVADGFTYLITYRGTIVRAAQGDVPAPLAPAVRRLSALLGEAC
jgi:hypothetical protein